MAVSEATYQRVALEDGDQTWELVCGQLRAKPPMPFDHADVTANLAFWLGTQLPRDRYRVHTDNSRTRISSGTYFVPDVAVIPMSLTKDLRNRDDVLEMYTAPLPLVVEVWSPSTGDYDVETKLPEYRQRGDAEIWLVHPYDRTVRAWRRQPNGKYRETLHSEGFVPVTSLPGVTIELAALFA